MTWSIRRPLLRGFLLEAGLAPCAAASSAITVVEGNAGDVEQHEQVVEHVGRLRRQPLAVALDRGDHRLDRLLAEFLGALRRCPGATSFAV